MHGRFNSRKGIILILNVLPFGNGGRKNGHLMLDGIAPRSHTFALRGR